MDAAVTGIVERWRAGKISAEIAVMQLLLVTEDLEVTRVATADAPALAAVLRDNEPGCARIVEMLKAGDDTGAPAPTVDAGLDATRRLFDRTVGDHEESSVALYSLGNPAILELATREVVEELDRTGVLLPDTRVVELGCGIGRFLAALAPRVRSVHGLDLSPGMVAAARRRCARLPNVRIDPTSGRDLRPVGDGGADLVLVVDAFPYVVQSGDALVEALFAEFARVLRPGGELALFQYSYRGDLDRDRADVRTLAARHGFAVEVDGTRPFRLWDGPAFRLSRARPDTARNIAPPP